MYSVVVAFGIASIMMCIGMVLRGKIKAFQNMLIPVSVIGGILGFFVMNLILTNVDVCGVTVQDFSNIVDVFFILSFISIGLTGGKKEKLTKEEKKARRQTSGPVRGGLGMALIWCILYAVQPLIGVIITALVGGAFKLDPMYGVMVTFAFCQGPGQASTYGKLFEGTYGYPNAEMIALAFAAIGFLAAFVVGVPLARYGLKKGLVSQPSTIDEPVQRGFFRPEEAEGRVESLGKTTFHSANVETMAAQFALMGISYLISLVMSKIVSYIPSIGPSFAAMHFMWGMFAAMIVKNVMRKLNLDYLVDDTLQSHITGFFSDYLVVCAFMAIQVSVLGVWIVPIILISVCATAATFFITAFFSARLGSDHDFERMLAVYGTATGTTPSGVSLLRIADPALKTSTGAELGIMNAALMFNTPVMIFITIAGLHIVSLPIACAGMFASVLIYLAALKILGVWRKPTFSFKEGKMQQAASSEA